MDIPLLTVTGFEQMEQQITQAGALPSNVGMTVILWRLQALVKGYRYALDHGYVTSASVQEDAETSTT